LPSKPTPSTPQPILPASPLVHSFSSSDLQTAGISPSEIFQETSADAFINEIPDTNVLKS